MRCGTRNTKRQLAELYTALETGDRVTVVPSSNRQRVARLNDAILEASNKDLDHFDDDDDGRTTSSAVCARR